jgi:hypothetical protein
MSENGTESYPDKKTKKTYVYKERERESEEKT